MAFRKISFLALLAVAYSWGAGVSFSGAPVPAGRFATGLTFDYSGAYLEFNLDSGSTSFLADQVFPYRTRNVYGFLTYGLANSINIGFDIGIGDFDIMSDIVNSDSSRAFGFDGRIGLTTGAHAKLATPYMGNVFALVGAFRSLWFYSRDKDEGPDELSESISGMSLNASAGFSFRVRDMGFISFGAKYHDLSAKHSSYGRTVGENGQLDADLDWKMSNDRNIGGFIALDFFPRTDIRRYIPFVSIEFSFFPDSSRPFTGTAPRLRNAGFSTTIGAFSRKLTGHNRDEIWRP